MRTYGKNIGSSSCTLSRTGALVVAFAAITGLTGLSVFSSSASAQQPEAQTFNFDDGESVSGNLMRPDGEIIDVPRTGRRPSLIRIRENFIPEMLRSAENL